MADATTGITSSAGMQQFLQLMVAQLSNQNPLDPVDQQDFLAQMAQFSTLGGIEQMNASFADILKLETLSQGSQLIGKTIQYNSPNGDQRTGEVTAARLLDSKFVVTVGSEDVALDKILKVLPPATSGT